MRCACAGAVLALLLSAGTAAAQTFATENPVLRRIWTLGMDSSQTYRLAQALFDSIGPRLTGTPGMRAASDWAIARYREWGITARAEQYGTWRGWRRGHTHIDLVAPRVRTLEGTMLAWSPGTGGRTVRGDVVILPDFPDTAAFQAWLPQVRGKFVAISFAEPTCRPDSDWAQSATPQSYERMRTARMDARRAWEQRIARTGAGSRDLPVRLESAGGAGILTSRWSNGWGVQKIFDARTQRAPTLDLSCEDYGLVFRLAEHSQRPVIDVFAESEALGEVPAFNTIAETRGTELPNEYVILSAHFDSWDGGSGTTDNGTGTIAMMEAMRILKAVYPNPRRTIVVGHWAGEEQGLLGSRAFASDHQEIVQGLQALFNQDNGTGRIVNMSAAGLTAASANLARWLSQVPSEITRHITFGFPGSPMGGGSDNASFICGGAPGFGLGSLGWNYNIYTWHTNRDTFDKIVFDDLKENAVLIAMLAYLASEDPERVPRDQRTVFPTGPSGRPGTWPTCQPPRRSSAETPR